MTCKTEVGQNITLFRR